jgi:hypothetical protein
MAALPWHILPSPLCALGALKKVHGLSMPTAKRTSLREPRFTSGAMGQKVLLFMAGVFTLIQLKTMGGICNWFDLLAQFFIPIASSS